MKFHDMPAYRRRYYRQYRAPETPLQIGNRIRRAAALARLAASQDRRRRAQAIAELLRFYRGY